MATTSYYYPQTITQNSGTKLKAWSGLNNLKNNNANNCRCNVGANVDTKNRPAVLTLSNFGVSLPDGAEVQSVIVEYAHQKEKGSKGVPNILAPTITVQGTSFSGVAPTLSMKDNIRTVKLNISKNNIESSKFHITINYPQNKNEYAGYINIRWFRIRVNYIAPSYSVQISSNNKKPEVGDTINITARINNLNRTAYNPIASIKLNGNGITYRNKTAGSGTLSVNNGNITWNPGLNKSKSSAYVTFQCYISDSSTKTVKISFSLNGKTYNHTVTIDPIKPPVATVTPATGDVDTNDDSVNDSNIQYVKTGEVFDLDFELSEEISIEDIQQVIITSSNDIIFVYGENDEVESTTGTYNNTVFDEDKKLNIKFKSDTIQESEVIIGVYSSDPNVLDPIFTNTLNIIFYPEGYPLYSIVSVDEETLKRMKDGFDYTVESNFKITPKVAGTTDLSDYYKNFRIGVFNKEITDYENLDEYLFDNTTSWSSQSTTLSEFETKQADFTYDAQYPIYIIVTGGYIDSNLTDGLDFDLEFTMPEIIETSVLEGHSSNVYFPTPFEYILENGTPTTLVVPPSEKSNGLLFYDFDIGEELETNNRYAIRGVKFSMDVEYSDEFILFAKLISPHGDTGERSIFIESIDSKEFTEDDDGVVSIGADFDLWGYRISDMIDLENWSLELVCSNLNGNGDATLIFDNVAITFYYMNINDELVTIKINGEDSRYYGMFINKCDIPAGLKSKVKYHDIDGSDLNDAYRMNIEKKEIELEFEVAGCDIYETTQLIRNIAKLLTNERDQLNKPIPKTFECSLYPDEHWDYILEEPLDSDVETACYTTKVKLIIPDGTSWDNEDTVTGSVGFIDSIAKVNPVIEITPIDEHIEITEEKTGQRFIINLDEDDIVDGDIIYIDCAERTISRHRLVEPDEGIFGYAAFDISETGDYHNDWFAINGEFNFNEDGCSIDTVTYTKRG